MNLTALKHQLQQNTQAFKKNKQNSTLQNNYQKPLRSTADIHEIKQSVHTTVESMIAVKRNSSKAYDCLVKHLKLLLQEAWAKNQFLVRDRAEILRQNFDLKHSVEQLTNELNEARQAIGQLKLNGYGSQVNGVFENGDIFKIGYESNSRLVDEKEHYSIGERRQLVEGKSDARNIWNSYKQSASPSSSSQKANQQSLLIRQVSAQFLPADTSSSPAPESYPSSEINQTPNYNYRQDMQQNINPVKNHYIDIGSEFISCANSCNGSGYHGMKNEGYGSKNDKYGRDEVEISLNNINNELYLPINQNKTSLKQEIQTFKEHLYLVNPGDCSLRQSHQHQLTLTNQLNQPNSSNKPNQLNYPNQSQHSQSLSNTRPTEFIYCSSSCHEGIFRAFYLSIIKYPTYRKKFRSNLQELLTDDTFSLFPLYPKNQFWVEMLSNFLQFISTNKPEPQEVLKHLNSHKLIDILLIQALKYRVQFLYNDCTDELNESSLLNGSIHQNPQLNTNRQSVNASFQQSPQEQSEFLQFFTALCSDFGLECKKDEKAFYFYESETESQSQVSSEYHPLFVIVNMEEMSAFGFEFSLYFEQSEVNGSRAYITNSQAHMRSSQQMNEYQNSVKKNFKDIEIEQPASQQKSSQNSNLLNSYNNSSNGKYMEEGSNGKYGEEGSNGKYMEERSFISQTNEYEDEDDNEYREDNEEDTSQQLSYIANTKLHKFNCTTRNITEMMNASSNEGSVRQSNEGIYGLDSERGRALRDRPIMYNTMQLNYPIREELVETESKQQLYNSFGKSNNMSNMSSLLTSPHISNNASKVLQQKKSLNPITISKHTSKANQRYKNLQDENFILKQVKSCQSEQSDTVVNDCEEDEDDAMDMRINIKLR